MAEPWLRAAADADFVDILDFSIARFGVSVGEDYIRSFEQPFALLRRHPKAGELRTDLKPPLRCLHHRQHRIFYDEEDDVVWIVRVLHRAMDAEALLRS
ncbi:MAG TPA: type II toxin-antitoxin system RelE/ParE family toxin [Allosphingosinicella sp.]|nr:type II toxin-antitoxin system RelE/ParE family toxin [Allosphingosinicella sp.]